MKWQTIDSGPKDGTLVLLSDGEKVGIGSWREDKGRTLIAADNPYWEEYDFSCWDIIETTGDWWFEPTHWMQLPEPPKETGE